MTSLVISLTEEEHRLLERKARSLGLSAKELVEKRVQELLEAPDDEFEKGSEYILNKNRKLYERLA